MGRGADDSISSTGKGVLRTRSNPKSSFVKSEHARGVREFISSEQEGEKLFKEFAREKKQSFSVVDLSPPMSSLGGFVILEQAEEDSSPSAAPQKTEDVVIERSPGIDVRPGPTMRTDYPDNITVVDNGEIAKAREGSLFDFTRDVLADALSKEGVVYIRNSTPEEGGYREILNEIARDLLSPHVGNPGKASVTKRSVTLGEKEIDVHDECTVVFEQDLNNSDEERLSEVVMDRMTLA